MIVMIQFSMLILLVFATDMKLPALADSTKEPRSLLPFSDETHDKKADRLLNMSNRKRRIPIILYEESSMQQRNFPFKSVCGNMKIFELMHLIEIDWQLQLRNYCLEIDDNVYHRQTEIANIPRKRGEPLKICVRRKFDNRSHDMYFLRFF